MGLAGRGGGGVGCRVVESGVGRDGSEAARARARARPRSVGGRTVHLEPAVRDRLVVVADEVSRDCPHALAFESVSPECLGEGERDHERRALQTRLAERLHSLGGDGARRAVAERHGRLLGHLPNRIREGELRGGGGARRGSRGVDLSLYVRQRLPRRGAALLPDAEERAWGARGTAGAAGRACATRRAPRERRAPRRETSSTRAARSTPHRAYTCAAAHHDRRGGARFGDDASQRSGAAAAFASRRDTGTECPTDRSRDCNSHKQKPTGLPNGKFSTRPSRVSVSTKCLRNVYEMSHLIPPSTPPRD